MSLLATQIPCFTLLGEVAGNFLEDVDQRRRLGNAARNRETKSFGLARAVIRILPDDHHLDLGKRREIERSNMRAAGG